MPGGLESGLRYNPERRDSTEWASGQPRRRKDFIVCNRKSEVDMSNTVSIGWVFGILLLPAMANAVQPEVVEETTAYRVYADGSVELKEQNRLEAELEAFRESELLEAEQESKDKQDLQRLGLQSGPASDSTVRGTLQENAVPGLWKGFGGVPYGCNGDIDVIEKGPDGKIYLGGRFSACNDVIVNNIAAWDPTTNTFEALGSPPGVGGIIRDLAFAPNGDLIGVGAFSRAGSASANTIARWDGSNWSGIGQDFFNSNPSVVDIDPATGNIHVGGSFTQIFLNGGGSLELNRIAVWNGTEWGALGDGFNSTVNALQFVNGTLYAGGRFSQSGTVTMNNIAAWDGTQWSDVGGGTDGTVEDLTSDGVNLFAGGFLSSAGGVSTGSIALWDGSQWSSIDGPTCCFGDMHYAGGKLFVTGGFSEVDGVSASSVAIWNGISWSGTGASSDFRGSGDSIFSDGTDIFLGYPGAVIGTFSAENFPDEGTFANRIVRFDAGAQQWQPLGNSQGNNLNGTVSDIIVVRDEVWISGNFSAAGTQPMPAGLARWNGSEWLPAPGDNPPCGNLGSLAIGNGVDVFAQTTCNFSFGTNWNNAARFDGSDWQSLDQGLSNSIFEVVVDTVTGDAYYAGSFTETEGDSPITVNRIARWDGAAWNPVGEGPENGVSRSTSSFASISSAVARNGSVMVEGSFDRAGTAEVDGLALWDGSAWTVPGNGLNTFDGRPFIEQLEGQGSNVFAAGFFNRSGTDELRNIAEWNGTSWVPLQGLVGEGTGSSSQSLHATENHLYVGGRFLEAGGRPAERIARWDGEDWRSLGVGSENGLGRANGFFSRPIDAMQSTTDGVFVGGFFGGSNAVASPNLIRFVPMENLDLDIEATITSAESGNASYEIFITNNGEFGLVDSSLVVDLTPIPDAITWTCEPVAPNDRGCPAASGSGAMNLVLELPAQTSLRFEVDVTAQAGNPFLDFEGTYSAAQVEGATGTLSDTVLISTTVSAEGVFKDGFE